MKLTYHFHVMIRYELEKALMEDEIAIDDIPAFWNERYLNYLGVQVPDDKQGCLQDVHWSHGSFGYFSNLQPRQFLCGAVLSAGSERSTGNYSRYTSR